MKAITLFAALIAAVPAAFGLTVNTPANVVECQPTQLSWSGGTAPYYLSLAPAGQPSATPLMTFPTQNGNSYTWTVNLPLTSFTIVLKDSTGTEAFSDIVTVQSGTDTSCLNGSSASGSASTGSSSGSATSAAAGGSSTAATTKASSGSATSAAASSSSTSTSSSSTPNGAGRLTVSAFGVAGFMGLVGAALF